VTHTSTPATYRQVFGHREFRVLFGITVLYVLGFQFELLALSVLVYARSGSSFLSALAFGVGFLPQAVGGLLLASLADRLPPRRLAVAGLAVRAVPGLVVGLVPHVPVAVMLVLVGAAALIAPVFSAATAGLLPDLLQDDEYVLGRSVLGLVVSGVQIGSLAVGGAVLAATSPSGLLLLAATALLGACATARAGLRSRPARATSAPGSGLLRASLAGHAELLADARVRGLVLVQCLPPCLVAGAEALLVPYAAGIGHVGRASYLLAALPLGMLAGDLVVGRLCPPATREGLSPWLMILLGLPFTAFAARPGLPLAVVLLATAGLGFSYALGLQRRFLAAVPQRLRGQAFGLMSACVMGGQGLVPVAAGALTTLLPPFAVIALLGWAITTTVMLLRRSFTGLRVP